MISINLRPLTELNGLFIEEIVQPNIAVLGWEIFIAEAFIAASLLLGFLSREGVLVSLLVSIQRVLGLAGIWGPAVHLNECEWSYDLMIALSSAVLGAAPGRIFGLDKLLRPRLDSMKRNGIRIARILLAPS